MGEIRLMTRKLGYMTGEDKVKDERDRVNDREVETREGLIRSVRGKTG